jgi:hypothetical protein
MVVEFYCDGADYFIVLDGVRIARRGHPGTSQAKTWISLEPGYTVRDNIYGSGEPFIEIEHEGVRIQ